MKKNYTILHIDTSSNQKTSIVLEIDGKRNEVTKITKTWTSQLLLPLINELLQEHKMTVQNINEIRVNPGPGSFTGIRVGVAVANALGFLLGIPVNSKRDRVVIPIYQ